MPIEYGKLAPGQKVSERSYVLDAEMVSAYVDAVGDASGLRSDEDGRSLAPPTAVAALSLRGVLTDLEIPGGTLHAGQEFTFKKAVPVGASLDCTATLAQNSVRGEWRFMVVDLEVTSGRGEKVMEGKSTILVPATFS